MLYLISPETFVFSAFFRLWSCGGEVWETPTGFLPKFFVSASPTDPLNRPPCWSQQYQGQYQVQYKVPGAIPTPCAGRNNTGVPGRDWRIFSWEAEVVQRVVGWTWTSRRWSNAKRNSTFHWSSQMLIITMMPGKVTAETGQFSLGEARSWKHWEDQAAMLIKMSSCPLWYCWYEWVKLNGNETNLTRRLQPFPYSSVSLLFLF